MPFYKDKENKLHFLDSTEFEHFLCPDCIAITDEEAETIRKAEAPPAASQDPIEKLREFIDANPDVAELLK